MSSQSPKYLVISLIVVMSLILFLTNANAATYFVRSGASGNGTSWANAWGGLGSIAWSSVAPGDTICIAGGTYSAGTTVTKSGTSSSVITVKRATAADPTCGSSTAGWNAAYDSQVVVNVGGGTGFYWNGGGNYVTVDGMAARGIKINIGDGGVGFGFDGNVSNVTMRNFETQGPGHITYSEECRGVDETPSSGSLNYIVVSHGEIHGCPTLMYLEGSNHATIEYTHLYASEVVNWASWHPNIVYWGDSNDGIFRYNRVEGDADAAEGLFFSTSGNSGGPYNQRVYVYGNVFVDGIGSSARAVESHQCCSWGPLYFYNNTFVNWPYAGLGLRGGMTGGEAYNNLFISSSANFSGDSGTPLTHDYNSSGSSLGEAHSTTITTSIFKDYATRDLHLAADTPVGASLPSPYNLDMDGRTRGVNGTFNRGAYEFGAATTTLPVAPQGLAAIVH